MAWSSLASLEIPTKAEVQEAIDAASQIITGSSGARYLYFENLNLMICWGTMYSSSTSQVYTSFPRPFSDKPYIVATENGRGYGASAFNKIPSWSKSGFYWMGDKCNGHYIAIGAKY